MAKEELEAAVAELGLSIKSEFVPFSRSRDAKEKLPTLNWRVTLVRNGHDVLTTDYGAGSGHAPSYNHRQTADDDAVVKWECEHGYPGMTTRLTERGVVRRPGSKPIEPDALDVIHSLALDSDVLDYSTFEEWAREFGYDADSRSAEKIYRACIEIALKLRAGLGDDGLTKLREAGQDY